MSGRPLRLLFTLPWATRSGGAEEMLQALVQGGPAHGYESELVFLQDGPWPEQLRAEGVPVHVLGGRTRARAAQGRPGGGCGWPASCAAAAPT